MTGAPHLGRAAAAAAAVAVLTALGAAAGAEMSLSTALPAVKCNEQVCPHAALVTAALSAAFDTPPTFTYIMGNDIADGKRTVARSRGAVTEAWAKQLFGYEDESCLLRMRGVTLLRLVEKFTASCAVPGSPSGCSASSRLMQFNNLRVRYSTTLPASGRLLGVDVLDRESGAFGPVNRTAFYTAGTYRWHCERLPVYSAVTKSLTLKGESITFGPKLKAIVNTFLAANSPYAAPDVDDMDMYVGEAGGTAMVVEHTAEVCAAMSPRHVIDVDAATCKLCPSPYASPDGAKCVFAAASRDAMPAVGDACATSDCPQGMLLADALRATAPGGPAAAGLVLGGDLSGKGWGQGELKPADVTGLHSTPLSAACTVTLTGAEFFRLVAANIAGARLPGATPGAAPPPLVQVSGSLRVHYGTAPGARARLLRLEHRGAAGWADVGAGGSFVVAVLETDLAALRWLGGATGGLADARCTAPHTAVSQLVAFAQASGGLTLETASGARLIAWADATPSEPSSSADGSALPAWPSDCSCNQTAPVVKPVASVTGRSTVASSAAAAPLGWGLVVPLAALASLLASAL